MRGEDRRSGQLFSYVNLEARVPSRHPLRTILVLANDALLSLSRKFDAIYAQSGRPSIPPERLLRALLLQALYSVRSERQLMEQLDHNLLFRWFVGMSVDEPVWDVTVFTKNRDRLLEGDVAKDFLTALLAQPKVAALLSNDHFSVDGTILEACAAMKSFVPKDGAANPGSAAGCEPASGGAEVADVSEADSADPASETGGAPPATEQRGRNAERDFHGEKRSNATHASTTDPDARLYRKGKGKESKLCHMGHVLMENRNGLVVGATVTTATGTAEREAAVAMLDEVLPSAGVVEPDPQTGADTDAPQAPGTETRADDAAATAESATVTLGADKGYDTKDFVANLTSRAVEPHVAQNKKGRRSAVPDEIAAKPGYAASICIRKRIEEVFGWMKTVGGQRKLRHRGTALVGWMFTLSAAAYNLVRLSRLLPGALPAAA